MTKNKLIKYIMNMIQVIKENPELFSDGIDEEIIELFEEIVKFIGKEVNYDKKK